MNVLFVHQNFPAQFKHLAPTLAARGDRVVAMCMNDFKEQKGVEIARSRGKYNTGAAHPWARDFDTKIIRAEASVLTAARLKREGFVPDVIVAHPAWGESLLLNEVWPRAGFGMYCELFYAAEGADYGFDTEFPIEDPLEARCIARLKNVPQRLHFDFAKAGISPTFFQADTYPYPFRDRITVVHDGIDMDVVRSDNRTRIHLGDGSVLTSDDEVITFVNNNLEPYRGYHVFMRALPELLRRRPNAHVIIVGGDKVSYGPPPAKGNWKDIFLEEVASDLDLTRVHFVGRVPYDVYLRVMQISSLHVYMTYPFVLSWSLIEAMAIEAPVLASDTAPLREVIEHGHNGRLFPFFDNEALISEACDLLERPSERQRLSRNARATVARNYDLRSVCLPRQIEWVDALAES